MQKKQILINAIMSVVQIVVISAIIFILYRFLLNTIGVKQLGIWSLVLATTSVTQIANLGLTGSVVKFAAKYIARGEYENVSKVIQTAAISVCIFVAIVLLIGYPIIRWILSLVIPLEFLPFAFGILPYALLALWLMIITSIFQAGLDGYQRIDIRSSLLMGGAILHLILCFMLAPPYGLMGLAYAKLVQNFLVLLGSWLLLKRYLPALPVIPYKWDKILFKEIIGYGINFQVISVASMFYDPITKALLSKFGGLSMVGYYEMASKMVLQFRSLIVSANQVLVPAIADLHEKISEKIKEVYLTNYQLLFYLALPLYSLIVISTPLISELWIGHYERNFVIFGTLLAIGWFLNTLNVPAYFANLGIGELRWNVIGQITIALLNAGFGFLSGIFYDGIGVVIAWVFSLALGSSIVYLSYHIRHKIPLIELLPKSSRRIAGSCLLSIFISLMVYYQSNQKFSIVVTTAITLIIFSVIAFIPLWRHPMRIYLKGWIINELLNKPQKR